MSDLVRFDRTKPEKLLELVKDMTSLGVHLARCAGMLEAGEQIEDVGGTVAAAIHRVVNQLNELVS
jgi:hypothetical protein